MRSTAFTAMLLAACGVMFGKNMTDPARSIGVFFSFEVQPSAATAKAMKNEVDSIMRPLGLSFIWRDLGEPRDGVAFADLIVVRFKGSCEGVVAPFGEPGLEPGDVTLASTETQPGQVLHFTDVRCDTVRRYLAVDVAGLHEDARNSVYGKALGRILAHEMYHIFGDTAEHSSEGIARACFSRQDLTKPVFTFAPREAQMLREYAGRALGIREKRGGAFDIAGTGVCKSPQSQGLCD